MGNHPHAIAVLRGEADAGRELSGGGFRVEDVGADQLHRLEFQDSQASGGVAWIHIRCVQLRMCV